MDKQAIVAGHICIDITPVFPKELPPVERLGDLLTPGSLICVDAPEIHTGGAVANTGLGMKVLGAQVQLLGKVGEDAFGRMVRDILSRHGAADGLIVDPGSSTSYSIVLAAPGIDRVFLHHAGANDTFSGADIPPSALEAASLFHFGYPPIMRRMYESGGRELAALFARVRERGLATSLDLAAVDAASPAGRADWREILKRTLPQVDFFVPSFEELCFMLDRERYRALEQRAGGGDVTAVLDLEDIRFLAQEALELGARAVLLKCGAPGLYLACSDRMADVGPRLELEGADWNGRSLFEKSYKIDAVRSATGAGDVSIAAFLAALLTGEGPEEALHLATGAGALCVQSYDAISGLVPLAELKAKIAAGWPKI